MCVMKFLKFYSTIPYALDINQIKKEQKIIALGNNFLY